MEELWKAQASKFDFHRIRQIFSHFKLFILKCKFSTLPVPLRPSGFRAPFPDPLMESCVLKESWSHCL